MDNKVTFAGREFELSPLRLKHLRRISKQIEETGASPRTPTFSDLDKWLPYIGDSISVIHQDFDRNLLDEMTIEEFGTVWQKILAVSGFKVVPKGEAQPTGALTTKESTGASPSAISGSSTISVN